MSTTKSGGVGRYVKRETPKNTTAPPKSLRAKLRDVPSNERDFDALRVTVPVTQLRDKEVNQGHQGQQWNLGNHVLSKFDETEYDESTFGSIEDNGDHQRYEPHEPQQKYHDDVDDEHEEGAYTEESPAGEEEIPPTNPELDNELRLAREHGPENMNHFQYPFSFAQLLTKHQEDLPVRSSSPAPLADQTPSRTRPRSAYNKPVQTFQRAHPRPPSQPVDKPLVSVPASVPDPAAFNKTSSYTDSPVVDRAPSPQFQAPERRHESAKKRPHHDELLDYDPEALQTVPFADLAAESFDVDPRHLSQTNTTTTAQSGSPPPTSPHNSTLTSLPSLSSPERASFFCTQTQSQWTASTQFFEEKLTSLFDQLRQARQHRREIALKYEDEVRERMQEVERSGEEIERSLGDIKGRARGVLPGRSGGAGGGNGGEGK